MSKNKNKIPQVTSQQKGVINDDFAVIEGGEDETNQHFKISYKYYKSNLCEIEDLPPSPARKCLTKLKQIGQSNRKTMNDNNIKPRPVYNSKNYKLLFHKLSDDVSLFEIDLGDASRLFYFIVDHTFHIVSIKNKHIEY